MSSVILKSSIASALPASTPASSYQFQLVSLSTHLKKATNAYNAMQSPENRTILNELTAHLKTLQINNKDNGASEDTVSYLVKLLADATEALKNPTVKSAMQTAAKHAPSLINQGKVMFNNGVADVESKVKTTLKTASNQAQNGDSVGFTKTMFHGITSGSGLIADGMRYSGSGVGQAGEIIKAAVSTVQSLPSLVKIGAEDIKIASELMQGKKPLSKRAVAAGAVDGTGSFTYSTVIGMVMPLVSQKFPGLPSDIISKNLGQIQDGVREEYRAGVKAQGVNTDSDEYRIANHGVQVTGSIGVGVVGKLATKIPKIKVTVKTLPKPAPTQKLLAPAKTQKLLAPSKIPAVEVLNSSVTPPAVWEAQAGAGRPITPATKPAPTLKPAPQVDFSKHPLSYADYNLKGFQAGDAVYKTPKGLKYARETIATAKKAIQSGDFGPFTAKQAKDIVARLEGQLRKAKLGSLVTQKAKTTPQLKAQVKAKQQQIVKIKAERERALVQESLRQLRQNAEWGVPSGSTRGYPRQYNMTEPFDAPEHGATHSNTNNSNNVGAEPQLKPKTAQNVNTRFYADLEPEIPVALTPELKAAEALANIKAGATPRVRVEIAIKSVAQVSTRAELHALKVALFSHPVTQNILNVFEFGIATLKKEGTFAKPIQPSPKTAVPIDTIVKECKALQLDFETQKTPSHPALVNRAAAFLLNLQTDTAINAFVAELGKKGGTKEYIAKSQSFKQKVIERRIELKPADNQNLPILAKPTWVGHDGEIRDAHDRHDNATYLRLSPDPFQDKDSAPVKPKNALKSNIENARNGGATSSLPRSVTEGRDNGKRFMSAEPFGFDDPDCIRDLFLPYKAPRSDLSPLLDGTKPGATPVKHAYYAPAWEGVLPPNQKPIFGSTGLSLGVNEIFATPSYHTIDMQGAKLSTPIVATMEVLSDPINGAKDISRAGHTVIHHSGISVNPKNVNTTSAQKDVNGLLIENITFGLMDALLSTGQIDSILAKLPSKLQGHALNVIGDLEARTKFDTKIGSNNIDVAAYMQELEAAGLGSVIDTGFSKKYISNTHTGSVGNAQTHAQNFIELFKSDPLVREELIHNLTESVRFTAQAEYNKEHNLSISREKLKIHVSPHTMRKLLQTSIKGLRTLEAAYPLAPSIKALADLYEEFLKK